MCFGILDNDSEAISAYHSYGSQSDEFMKCESHQILHARLHRERKGIMISKIPKSTPSFLPCVVPIVQ